MTHALVWFGYDLSGLGFRVRLTMEPTVEKVERVATPETVAPLMRDLGRALDRLPAR